MTRRAANGVMALAVALTALVVTPGTPASGAPPALPAPNSHGITLVRLDEVAFDARLLDATVRTNAIFQAGSRPTIDPVVKDIKVRIYLPAGYDAGRATPYPVLYLLHGGAGDFTAWSNDNEGDIRDLVNASAFRGIVVMPEGGNAAFYGNWAGYTDGNFRPAWETFHVQQLVPWIDANFNTSGTRDGRAIAGLSMGGSGALRYAGRHPTLFSAVGSFSGGTDIREAPAQAIISDAAALGGASIGTVGNMLWYGHGLTDGNYRGNRKLPDGRIDPDQAAQRAYRLQVYFGPPSGWGAANPYQMADAYNAYDTRLALYAGGQGGDATSGEGYIGATNQRFHQELGRVGVQHRWCHGAGAHDWGYWRNDLVNFLDYIYGGAADQCPNGWAPPS